MIRPFGVSSCFLGHVMSASNSCTRTDGYVDFPCMYVSLGSMCMCMCACWCIMREIVDVYVWLGIFSL
jgi:hypothetical protein